MNHEQPPFDEERQFNFSEYLLGQMFGTGNQKHPQNNHGGNYPGQNHHGGYYPGYHHPGNQFPGHQGGQNQGHPGGSQSGEPPKTPPPPFTPEQQQFQTFAVDPGAIRGCLFRFTYVWLRRDAFWFFPIFVGRNSIAGYRWHRNRWTYYGIDLDKIQSFQCF